MKNIVCCLAILGCLAGSDVFAQSEQTFTAMAWNIWHGGIEDGADIGPQRIIDVIKNSGADVVAMQETYGSGERVSKALNFEFHPRGTNVSIHSRFPVVEDISVFQEFKCVGALLELPDKRRIAFYSIWLPYNQEIWAEGTRVNDVEQLKAACQASCDDLKKIKSEIEKRLADEKYANVPVVIAGDFNSMSHLDYIPSAQEEFGVVVDWPTSRVLLDDGFRDSYRELHPEVNRQKDRTWTPRFPDQEQDRIDFIMYRGNLSPRKSVVIDTHYGKFPSDHAALVTQFVWPTESQAEQQLRFASYNIKHGLGNDNRLDLARTAALLNNLRADVIGLQEVDNQCQRSDGVDQPEFFAKQLKMNSAFGSFMNFQGGQYGLAILSRFPIIEEHEIRLPDGNEPRVALACELETPGGHTFMAVNVHFDWVNDDGFRFAQAQKLAEFLSSIEMPYVLLGDFNDVLGSRTLNLLSQGAIEADKPQADSFTFSAIDPRIEIDFVFASPENRWEVRHCQLFEAQKTSDHRPVLAILELVDE